MQHKRGKVEAYEWGGTPCACLTPDTMRLPHARHRAGGSSSGTGKGEAHPAPGRGKLIRHRAGGSSSGTGQGEAHPAAGQPGRGQQQPGNRAGGSSSRASSTLKTPHSPLRSARPPVGGSTLSRSILDTVCA